MLPGHQRSPPQQGRGRPLTFVLREPSCIRFDSSAGSCVTSPPFGLSGDVGRFASSASTNCPILPCPYYCRAAALSTPALPLMLDKVKLPGVPPALPSGRSSHPSACQAALDIMAVLLRVGKKVGAGRGGRQRRHDVPYLPCYTHLPTPYYDGDELHQRSRQRVCRRGKRPPLPPLQPMRHAILSTGSCESLLRCHQAAAIQAHSGIAPRDGLPGPCRASKASSRVGDGQGGAEAAGFWLNLREGVSSILAVMAETTEGRDAIVAALLVSRSQEGPARSRKRHGCFICRPGSQPEAQLRPSGPGHPASGEIGAAGAQSLAPARWICAAVSSHVRVVLWSGRLWVVDDVAAPPAVGAGDTNGLPPGPCSRPGPWGVRAPAQHAPFKSQDPAGFSGIAAGRRRQASSQAAPPPPGSRWAAGPFALVLNERGPQTPGGHAETSSPR